MMKMMMVIMISLLWFIKYFLVVSYQQLVHEPFFFPNSIFAREGAFHLRSSTVTLSEVFSPFRVLYLFVALSKATYAENSHIVVSSRYEKAFILNLLCVLFSA